MRFSAFVDRKVNKARKELEVVRDVLEEGGVKVEDRLGEQDPFIFVPSTKQSLDFGGVRIYKIGSDVAYRLQNEVGTEPYGTSYSMDIEGMFEDLISEMGEDKAAVEVKKAVVEEISKFFEKSLKAQDELSSSGFDSHNKVIVAPGKAGDISNMM